MTDQLPMPIPAPLTRAQRNQLLNLLRRASKAEILPRFRKLDQMDINTKSGALDLVTEADTAAEAMITRGLQMSFPAAKIIGEEAVSQNSKVRDGIAEAEMCFFVDPVDGTWNFANGLSTFGTMVAVTRFGKPVFSMIYDPIGDDVVWADENTATTFLSTTGAVRKLKTAESKDFSEMVGFLPLNLMPEEHKPAIAALYPEFAMLGALRCSAHEYRLLSQGGCDFVLSCKGQTPWDHAPGEILCRQAGGHTAMLDGSEYSAAIEKGFLLSASSKETWDRVAEKFAFLVDVEQKKDAA